VAIGAIAFWSPAEHEDTITALLSNGVRGFLEPGTRAKTTVLAQLPYGLQLAQIKLVALRHPTVAHGALLALAGHNNALGDMPSPSGVRSSARWWQRPASPPAGPCQLRAVGPSGLVPQWGHVATTVRPFPGHVIGRAFFSCVDTEYYLQGWPLDAAILLDAAHPGSPPAAIPGLSAVRGARGLLDGSGAFAGDITARRAGNAWLVVAGGDGLAQRLEVLRHLIPTISLPRT